MAGIEEEGVDCLLVDESECLRVREGEGDDDPVEVERTDAPISISMSVTSTTSLRVLCLNEAPPSFRARRRSSLLLDYLGKKLGGNFSYEPEDMLREEESVDGPTHQCSLSPATQRMLSRCFKDIDPEDIVDYHVHLVGHGDGGSGCTVHQATKQWWKPFERLKAAVFMFASQVPDMDGGDLQYISRLIRLIKHFTPLSILDTGTPHFEDRRPTRTSSLPKRYGHGKYCLLAFDAFHEKDGTRNDAKTTLYVPNDYAIKLGAEFPEYFYPVGSVNPYRVDAERELERCARRGITIIKWLPNSVGIHPAEKRCDNFYKKMKELNLTLLVHVGEEHSVTTGFIDNRLGNPLFLRRPLSFGVRVIAAHCATEGNAVDLESNPPRTVPCFELFMRLMNEQQYENLLFADISAICGFKRVSFLKRLLAATLGGNEPEDILREEESMDGPTPPLPTRHTEDAQEMDIVTT